MAAGNPRIGFIGVGLMGHGIAKNLLAKGFPLTVRAHRNRAPVDDLVAKGRRSPRAIPSWRATPTSCSCA
jgi:3-hydroxyisobutyrate dehydrogenase-like beta-hydroxyacid dehydrogenase